jgi:hypothetical protein
MCVQSILERERGLSPCNLGERAEAAVDKQLLADALKTCKVRAACSDATRRGIRVACAWCHLLMNVSATSWFAYACDIYIYIYMFVLCIYMYTYV